MLNKFKKMEGKMEKCSRGHSRSGGKKTVSKKEEHRLDRAEDRTGKLENRLLEYNQVETREKY